MEQLKITLETNPTSEELAVLADGIVLNTLKQKGSGYIQPFAFLTRNDSDEIVAGVSGAMFYGCMYIDQTWVHEDYQRQKIGTKLIEKAEGMAIKLGCRFSTVNTMNWEARPFYEKLGYFVEFERHGYDGDGILYHLRKELEPEPQNLDK